MKYKIVNQFPNDFFGGKNGPLISIYQATSRYLTDNKRDALVFKGLVKSVEVSLKEKHSKSDIKPLMQLFEKIENEHTFWSHTFDGIALFATLDECIIYHLKRPIITFAVVADTFHIKPLIQYYQLFQTYQILDLDAKSFQILEGSPYHLDLVKLDKNTQTTMDEILGTELEESYHTKGAYGGASDSSVFHGHGGSKDEIEIDIKRFFRQVDNIVDQQVSKVSKLPMILLSPSEYHTLYIELSNNFYLEDRAITGAYETLEKEALMKELEAYAMDTFNLKIGKLKDKYHQLKAQKKSSDQLIDIITATIEGRVEALFIQENLTVPGKIDMNTKKMTSEKLDDPKVDDVLDDLAQLVLDKSGEVYILSRDDMPTDLGMAAIYRY